MSPLDMWVLLFSEWDTTWDLNNRSAASQIFSILQFNMLKVLECMSLKLPSTKTIKILLIITSIGCLTLPLQNQVCAEFDTRGLFAHSAAKRGELLRAQLRSECVRAGFVTWLEANCGPVCRLQHCDAEQKHWEWTLQWGRHFVS